MIIIILDEKFIMFFFNILLMIFIQPIIAGFYTVLPLEAVVLMFMGKVVRITKKPGLFWFFPIGRTIKRVSLGK